MIHHWNLRAQFVRLIGSEDCTLPPMLCGPGSFLQIEQTWLKNKMAKCVGSNDRPSTSSNCRRYAGFAGCDFAGEPLVLGAPPLSPCIIRAVNLARREVVGDRFGRAYYDCGSGRAPELTVLHTTRQSLTFDINKREASGAAPL